jgi:hypothetical protein
MPDTESEELIIHGVTNDGRTFRPSDWAQRLACVFSSIGEDNRMCYSPYVQPVRIDGLPCVVVSKRMQQDDPASYGFLLAFARDNALKLSEGRRQFWRETGGQTAAQ